MARILTLEEITDLRQGPMWMQEKGTNKTLVVTYHAEHIPYFMFDVHSIGMAGRIGRKEREYGKTWRCFEIKPRPNDLRIPFQE